MLADGSERFPVMYLTDWVEQPFNRPLVAGFYVVFLMLILVLGNLGFALGHHWIRLGRHRWVTCGAILGGLLTVLPFLLRWGVWWKVGTYQDFLSGSGYSFWSPPFFWGWLVVMSYLAVSSVIAGLWFLRQSTLAE